MPTPAGGHVMAARHEQSVSVEQSVWTSPIPPAHALAEYQALIPDAPERFLRLAEQQSAHRRSMEAKVVTSNIWRDHMGQVFAFLLAAGAMGGGFWMMHEGRSAEGLTTFLSAVAGLAAVFVTARRRQARELAAKSGGDALARRR
ncbi:MAG: DUF2335 domain-containing protein [Gemmatimonadetes bacterium]|jgi:uncharacterized membrane protein|nr:DUF2335 domain-containing protein [Gemmatimonadota bacterium]MBK6455383.1 DUF2335 domain-containing protein [Gemmatimonadota bacterium]MBK7835258.1 DUF2335 domain-containing protein [Gemmatimonadota bacterium]MBK9406601.1 DUF2335 domain-containing protein [Gemmatimonadota bacterium]